MITFKDLSFLINTGNFNLLHTIVATKINPIPLANPY